jgi:hypothetical protein
LLKNNLAKLGINTDFCDVNSKIDITYMLKASSMSPKLPVNNSQTITEFLNLHKAQISEEESVDSYKFAFDDEAFLSRRETIGIRFELRVTQARNSSKRAWD